MEKFDRSNIYNRALARLNNNDSWRAVSQESVISALLKTNAEMNAETARYAEYLFRESRWDYAQNESSIMAQANMLGYRPRRATCASGKVHFTSTPSQFSGTDSTGMDFVINSIDDNGDAVMFQGVKKTVELNYQDIMSSYTESKLDPYIYVPVVIEKCDDASTSSTKNFFKVETSTDGDNWKNWKVASTTLFNNGTDSYIEVYNDVYSYNLFYLKFNNDPNRGSVLPMTDNGLRIKISYLETLGAKGNIGVINKQFKFGSVIAYNTEPISGGQDAETIEDLKRSAPRYYLRSYTTGTKHAYQEAIKNIGFTFGDGTPVSYPTNVIVWGSKEKDTSGSQVPITCISFVAPNLEDWASNLDINNPDPYAPINKQMREYLDDLKSPQDILKFVMPNYVPFAVNTKVKVSRDNSVDVNNLKDSAKSIISDLWGSNSSSIDFNRDFYPTEIIKEVSSLSPFIRSVEVETEAVTRIEWQNARRMTPNTSSIIHTFRVPFDFDKVFSDGMQGIDKQTGWSIRIDFMYRKPSAFSSNLDNSVSIFVGRTAQKNGNPSRKPFYAMKDNGSVTTNGQAVSNIWASATMTDADYSSVKRDVYRVTNAYQYRFKREAVNDEDYEKMNKDVLKATDGIVSTEGTGVIPSYLVYYSDDNVATANGRIGSGSFLELPFDGLWELLTGYGVLDVSMDALKCSSNSNESSSAFTAFINALDQYVECVVSMKPVNTSGLVIRSLNGDETDSTVLYIDNSDGDKTGMSNLTPLKMARMNSVKVEYL